MTLEELSALVSACNGEIDQAISGPLDEDTYGIRAYFPVLDDASKFYGMSRACGAHTLIPSSEPRAWTVSLTFERED